MLYKFNRNIVVEAIGGSNMQCYDGEVIDEKDLPKGTLKSLLHGGHIVPYVEPVHAEPEPMQQPVEEHKPVSRKKGK